MTDAEAVRRVALALPRAYEVQVRGQWKFRVGQILFVAFSADEQEMGFGFPRAERDALVAAEPEKFFLPTTSDLHFHDGATRLRGRIQVMTHLADHPTPRPPTEVEIRDGQLYRWIRRPARRN